MLILTYHSIRDGYASNRFVTAPGDFEMQVRTVMKRRRFVDLRMLDPDNLPEDGALLTFDDGYEDNLKVALPIAMNLGVPMAVFPATHFLGRTMKLGGAELPCLSPRQIREMDATGMVAFGSHSHNHVLVDETDDPELLGKDLAESARILSDLVGYGIDAFVYPKGRYNASLRSVIAGRFRMAFRGGGLASSSSDPLQIPRVELLNGDTWLTRKLKMNGLYYRMRRIRYQRRKAVSL